MGNIFEKILSIYIFNMLIVWINNKKVQFSVTDFTHL